MSYFLLFDHVLLFDHFLFVDRGGFHRWGTTPFPLQQPWALHSSQRGWRVPVRHRGKCSLFSVFLNLKDFCRFLTDFSPLYLLYWEFSIRAWRVNVLLARGNGKSPPVKPCPFAAAMDCALPLAPKESTQPTQPTLRMSTTTTTTTRWMCCWASKATPPTPPCTRRTVLTCRRSPTGQVREICIIHVGGTRCVPSSTDHIMKRQARITLKVECTRTCNIVFLLQV